MNLFVISSVWVYSGEYDVCGVSSKKAQKMCLANAGIEPTTFASTQLCDYAGLSMEYYDSGILAIINPFMILILNPGILYSSACSVWYHHKHRIHLSTVYTTPRCVH